MSDITLGFDDVTLVPQYSEVLSRSVPDTSVKLGEFVLQTPILSANMDTVTGHQMAIAMHYMGGIGTLHRFMSIEDNVTEYRKVRDAGADCFVTVGVRDWGVRGSTLASVGATHFVIDIAHGHSSLMKDALAGLKVLLGDSGVVMAGNVATPEAVADLVSWGADIVKIGVSSGACCKTRVVTGHGLPMFTTVLECAGEADRLGVQVVADGGIRSSGDIVKAFVAGADAVMLGSLLSGTPETPGDVFVREKGFYKRYRGMASTEARWARDGDRSDLGPAEEGVSTAVKLKPPVADVIHELTMGLKSGMSYCNAFCLPDIHTNAKWRRQTFAAHVEGTPHILQGSDK